MICDYQCVCVVCRQDELLLASPDPCSVLQNYSKREHNKIGYRSQATLPCCASLPVLVKSRARGSLFLSLITFNCLTLIYTEDEGSRFHRNVGTYQQNCTVSRSVRSHFLFGLISDAAATSTQG